MYPQPFPHGQRSRREPPSDIHGIILAVLLLELFTLIALGIDRSPAYSANTEAQSATAPTEATHTIAATMSTPNRATGVSSTLTADVENDDRNVDLPPPAPTKTQPPEASVVSITAVIRPPPAPTVEEPTDDAFERYLKWAASVEKSFLPSVARWRPMVETTFPVNQWWKALRIIQCESTGNPNAINQSSRTTGLFQIHPDNIYRTQVPAFAVVPDYVDMKEWSMRKIQEWLMVPENNFRSASLMWEYDHDKHDNGWKQWECKPR